MKLSVLVTFYNQMDFVFDCLNSILTQKVNFDYEILIGDDGSSDGTRDRIEVFLEQNPNKIRLFVMPRDASQRYNKFQRAGLNRANLIKHATGEYITICDGDDYYTDSCKLQLQVDALEDNKSCIGCAHDVEYWIQKEQRTEPFPSMGIEDQVISPKKYLRSVVPFCTMALMWRNVFNGQLPAVLPEKYVDDYCITIYMLNFGNLFHIKRPMAHYRVVDNSLWQGASGPERVFEALARERVALRVNRKYPISVRKKYSSFNVQVYESRWGLASLHSDERDFYREIARDVHEQYLLTVLDWERATLPNKAKAYARYLAYKIIQRYF